jgi:hypothetical protein
MTSAVPPAVDVAAEVAARLRPNHLADLRRSGLSDETILAANLRSIDDPEEAGKVLGWKGPAFTLGPCLLFPFHGADAAPLKYGRLKPDRPRRGKDGKVNKYEAPKGKPNRPYFPPRVAAALDDPLADLFLCEGEKKGLCGTQRGFPTIALSGVYAWQVKRKRVSTVSRAGRDN